MKILSRPDLSDIHAGDLGRLPVTAFVAALHATGAAGSSGGHLADAFSLLGGTDPGDAWRTRDQRVPCFPPSAERLP